MTDQYGRPLSRPANKIEADALARKYAGGELPSNEYVREQERVASQFSDDGEYDPRDDERIAKIYENLMRNRPSSDEV